MGGYIWGTGLALLAAIGVIVLANRASEGGTDVRTFWADLRRGLRREPAADDAPVDVEPEPVDVPFDRFFAEAPQTGDGYLQLDELAELLERTGERAGRLREHLPHPRAAAGHPAAARAPRPRVPARRTGHVPVGTVPAPHPRTGDGPHDA